MVLRERWDSEDLRVQAPDWVTALRPEVIYILGYELEEPSGDVPWFNLSELFSHTLSCTSLVGEYIHRVLL